MLRSWNVRLPAIGQDVAKFVTKLIGELRPGLLTDVDDDPRHSAAIGVQPHGRRPRPVLINAQSRGLAVGDQAHPIKAGVSHALNNLIGRPWKHVAPITRKFDGRG